MIRCIWGRGVVSTKHPTKQLNNKKTKHVITQDQLKEVQQRCEALNRYLDIPAKRMQYEEEQIRTQAPEFW